MLQGLWGAAKRTYDLTVAPVATGIMLSSVEWFFGMLEWAMLAIAQVFTNLLVGMLDLLPLPDDLDPHALMNSEVVRIAAALNIFLALQIWFVARIAAFIVKVLTVGVVRK